MPSTSLQGDCPVEVEADYGDPVEFLRYAVRRVVNETGEGGHGAAMLACRDALQETLGTQDATVSIHIDSGKFDSVGHGEHLGVDDRVVGDLTQRDIIPPNETRRRRIEGVELVDNIVSTGSTFISADAYQIVASVKVAGGGYRHITITVEQRDGGRYGREYEHLEGMKDCYPGDDAHMTHLSSIQQAATDVCMIAGLEKERIKQVVIEGKSASESRCDGTRPADSA